MTQTELSNDEIVATKYQLALADFGDEDDVEAAKALDASAREAKREEEARARVRRTGFKSIRSQRRKLQRKTAKVLGHKLGHNNRVCKRCSNPRLVILGAGTKCSGTRP